MRIVEIRDLDGPNLFLMAPAIKIEIEDVPEDQCDHLITALRDLVGQLHTAIGQNVPELTSRRMEEPGHIVVAFGWEHRAFALSVGEWAAQLVVGERADHDQVVRELREILRQPAEEDDAPLLVHASADRMPIVAVTGTNGKTTTSRLIEFVLRHAGNRVGLTSSAGVFVNAEQEQEGDYSGPSGARQVLGQADVDFAVLETARGGLLLRGAGYDQADVAVITNVSEDHLGLHGIHSIEGLAAVKAIVARNIKPGGFCVLNADDPQVIAMKEITPGEPVLFSSDPGSVTIQNHLKAGGLAIFVDDEKNVIWSSDGTSEEVISLAAIPMTFGGLASHQVQNALAATAALIGLGLPLETIRVGLTAFRSSAENSKGRLNLFKVNDAKVIIDFAHNEAGLKHLLTFARHIVEGHGRLIAVVGTAGDRDDAALQAIAKCAVSLADVIVLKDSVHYLRGREPGSMVSVMRQAIVDAGYEGRTILEAADERTATLEMTDQLQPGDVLAVMCVEDYDFLLKELGSRGQELV